MPLPTKRSSPLSRSPCRSRSNSQSHSQLFSKWNSKSSRKHNKSNSRSRSRSSSRSRKRSHSRSYKHSSAKSRSSSNRIKEKRRTRRRSYDSYSSDESGSYNSRGDRQEGEVSYKYQQPYNTIMVRGLANHHKEIDVRNEVLKCGISAKDVRLIRDKDTGVSRGFAFVEFNTLQDSVKWMDMKKGILTFEDQTKTTLIFSYPKPSGNQPLADWQCATCKGRNFRKRDVCYKCQALKPADYDRADKLNDEVVSYPSKTILLSGLDTLTTEDNVLEAFQENSQLSLLPIKSVKISREMTTNMSRGFCYIESNSVADSVKLFDILASKPLQIDSRDVSVAYCKPTYVASSLNSVAAAAVAAAQWTNNSTSTLTPSFSDQVEIERLAQYSASLYAKTAKEHASYLDYYRGYYEKNKSNNNQDSSITVDSLKNNEESVSMVYDNFKAVASSGLPDFTSTTGKTLALPSAARGCVDVSRFKYDESSKYYYDPVTLLYYDPSTQYFYDSTQKQFLHWNGQEKRYIPVQTETTCTSSSGEKRNEKREKKGPKKEEKVKIASKISKDMEKWAKSLNQKKELSKFPFPAVSSATNPWPQELNKGIDTGASAKYWLQSQSDLHMLPTAIPTSSSKECWAVSDDGTHHRGDVKLASPVKTNNHNFADYVKIACLLCKRQFPNIVALNKHLELSELHKENVTKFLKEVSSS